MKKRIVAAVTTAAVGLTWWGTMPASAAGPGITITSPAAGATVAPGDVHIQGTAGTSAKKTDYVLFVTDLSGSTASPTGLDCTGDGNVGSSDDLNSDGSVGDVLDCEIAALRAVNNDLVKTDGGTGGIQVGIEAFADSAAVAHMNGAGAPFVAPATDDGTMRNFDRVATSLRDGEVHEYDEMYVGGGTDFDAALDSGLDALQGVSGNKWVFFLSDGQASVSNSTLGRVASSGVKVRTFAIGQGAGAAACDSGYPLREIADASGEGCLVVSDPANLPAGLTTSAPEALDSVTVSGLTASPIPAAIDPLGNWDAVAQGLTEGSYSATATAKFTDGTSASTSVSFTVKASTGAVERWDGKDRYEASAKISERSFQPGVDTAFVASGLIFTDALSGSAIAGSIPGPMLLVKTDSIPAAIAAELSRLQPKRIVVLGGTNTITPSVESQLAGYAGQVVRWDGKDRYEASAQISARSFQPGAQTAFVASGLIFTDALSGSPIAGKTPGPMLLTKPDVIPGAIATELTRLKPKEIVVLGGPATIEDAVQKELKRYTKGTVERWDGLDRYEASAKISAKSFRPGVKTAYIASGLIFTDALSGSPVAGATPGPMLLVKTGEIPPAIETELARLKPKRIVVLGGPATINQDVETQLGQFTSAR